ncbi:MAG TPA: hypothetical protein VM123_00955 [archaeon]|nr:hypothetical protein [archaeon]
MKIATLLKRRYKGCNIFAIVGNEIPPGVARPSAIYITSLFTWDLKKVTESVQFYSDRFPGVEILVGGIAASLLPDYIKKHTGISPHIGLFDGAEHCAPDYSLWFKRKINASITFASRGCPRQCRFCSVRLHEPEFIVRDDWDRDICKDLPRIIFWDNNWLASPNFLEDCEKIKKLGKIVDFNQGLDARLYDDAVAKHLAMIKIDPIRFAFDDINSEAHVLQAIKLAKRYSKNEVRVYVLYNFMDTPEDFYYRISLLNQNGALAFPMEYRKAIPSQTKFPGPHWNTTLLRALKLSLIFYYRKGMITESRESFLSIYGKTADQFVSKLYEIYEYDKKLKRKTS